MMTDHQSSSLIAMSIINELLRIIRQIFLFFQYYNNLFYSYVWNLPSTYREIRATHTSCLRQREQDATLAKRNQWCGSGTCT